MHFMRIFPVPVVVLQNTLDMCIGFVAPHVVKYSTLMSNAGHFVKPYQQPLPMLLLLLLNCELGASTGLL
jgi:hypothetical protein